MMEEINELLEQIHALLDDYEELLEMEKDTTKVEKEIDDRVRSLKIKTRVQIESSFDIPVILDGELLTFEKAIKKKKYIDDEFDRAKLDNISIKNDGDRDYYYYLEKEIYHLDIDEEYMMTAIRFINSKKDWDKNYLSEVLNAIAHLCVISYGYRLVFEGTIEKKLNVENFYTGTVFNNSSYSIKTYNLLDKLFLKIAEDYIKRIKSSYDIGDYIIHKVENRWLVINRKNGATDILEGDESKMCEIANDVVECFDEDNILKNSESTDERIKILQQAVELYIRSLNKKI